MCKHLTVIFCFQDWNSVSKILFWGLENQLFLLILARNVFLSLIFIFYVDLFLMFRSFEIFLFHQAFRHFSLPLSTYFVRNFCWFYLQNRSWVHLLLFLPLHSSHPGTCSLLTGLSVSGAASPGLMGHSSTCTHSMWGPQPPASGRPWLGFLLCSLCSLIYSLCAVAWASLKM